MAAPSSSPSSDQVIFTSSATAPFPGQNGTAYLIPHPTFRPNQMRRRVVFTIDDGYFRTSYTTADEPPFHDTMEISATEMVKAQFLAQRRQPHPDNPNIIWIDAFDGAPENKQVYNYFTLLEGVHDWQGLVFMQNGIERFKRRHNGARPPPPIAMMLFMWSQQQGKQGKIEFHTLKKGGFRLKLVPKGGFFTEQATGGASLTSFSMFG